MEIVEELHQSTEGKEKGSQSQNSKDVGYVNDERIRGDGKDSRNCYHPSLFQTSKSYDLKSISTPRHFLEWASEIRIQVLSDEVEEGSEL